jgi:hypothetical protein
VADEMGLGKSLVILSVIAGSLDEARRFGAQKTPQQTRTPSKATLIIVPSTCKLTHTRITPYETESSSEPLLMCAVLIDNWIKEIQR